MTALLRAGTEACEPISSFRLAIPVDSLPALLTVLARLQTRGEGVLESEFARYQPVRGTPPAKPRIDGNPLDL
jgi:ribosomal protection tetracycline resistance protein